MKLINKKTGEILDDVKYIDTSLSTIEIHYLDNGVLRIKTEKDYHSFLQNWGGYKHPKEPLIKDEKIRKAVRAWAEANRVAEARYSSCHDAECEFNARDDENKSIVFIGNFVEMNERLDYSGRTIYTIDKLCGELHNDANM